MILSKIAALMLAATVAATPAVQYVCTMDSLPGEIALYGEHTREEALMLKLTTCSLADGAEAPADITAGFPDKASYGIPEDAARGYVFELKPMAGAEVTPADLGYSIECFLKSDAAPERLTRMNRPVPGEVKSLEEVGLSSAEQAVEAGYPHLYVDVSGFWGLGAGWRSVTDRTRLRDWAIPGGLDEMYVTPAYLYNLYLRTGGRYQKMQREFVGVAVTEEMRSGILVQEDRVLLIFPVPTTASVVRADLENAVLQRSDGSLIGQYTAERTEEGILLTQNETWWGSRICDAPEILCRTGSGE